MNVFASPLTWGASESAYCMRQHSIAHCRGHTREKYCFTLQQFNEHLRDHILINKHTEHVLENIVPL
jgi:hypothetical protein